MNVGEAIDRSSKLTYGHAHKGLVALANITLLCRHCDWIPLLAGERK